MTSITIDQPKAMLDWAARRVGVEAWPDDSKAIGAVHDGRLVGVVVYNMFLDQGCSIHIATDKSRRWATRRTLDAFFRYPFIQCGLHRITGYTPADNMPALVLITRLGFRFEGVQREAFNGRDLVVSGMLKRECRFLLPRDGEA